MLDKLEPGNSALNVAVRWRIEGELTARLIERVFAESLKRREPLRTASVETDGEPLQIVRAKVPLRVPSIDLAVRPGGEAFAECDRIARFEATAPFNPAIASSIGVTHVRVRSDALLIEADVVLASDVLQVLEDRSGFLWTVPFLTCRILINGTPVGAQPTAMTLQSIGVSLLIYRMLDIPSLVNALRISAARLTSG